MLPSSLIDYDKCHEYARTLCGSYGIPECDVADIGSDAFLLSIRRAWRADPGANEDAVARRLMYTSVINVINRRNNKAIRILSDAEELNRTTSDEGSPSDDDVVEERFAANDKGETEERLTVYLDWQNPFWLRLFNSERQKLRDEKNANRGRKTKKNPLVGPMLRVIRAGLKDSRLSVVWHKTHFSWSRFQEILREFKVRFALCFQALRAWRGE